MRWVVGFALAVASVLVLVPNHPGGRVPAEDAGVFLYVASVALDGGLPYRDVWDHKPPGVYAVSAMGLAVGGGSEMGVWLVQVLCLIAAAALGYAALTRAFGPAPAFFASLAWLASSARLFLADGTFTIFAEFFALPLQFALLYAVATWPVDRRVPLTRPTREALIGVLGGMALLLKPTLIALWLALAVVLALVDARDPGRLAWRGVRIAAGGLVPLLATAVLFIAGGALPDLWDQAFAYNVANSATATVGDRAIAAITGVRLTAPSGIVVLAALGWVGGVTALVRRAPAPVGLTPLLAVAIVAAPLEIALASVPGRPYHYYYLAWLPSFAVLTAFVARLLEAFIPRFARTVLAVLLLLSMVQPALLLTRLSAIRDDGLSRAAVRYLLASTGESDTVLLWGARSEINFLSRRRAPTRFVYQYAPLYTRGYATSERVSEFLTELERRRPPLILDVSGSSFATPPLDVAAIRAWISPEPRYQPLELDRVANYILANYENVGTVPDTGWPAFRRRAQAGLPRAAEHASAVRRVER